MDRAYALWFWMDKAGFGLSESWSSISVASLDGNQYIIQFLMGLAM